MKKIRTVANDLKREGKTENNGGQMKAIISVPYRITSNLIVY
ncbi:Uncharacterised protein [Proteus vulgaris]|uniref:Uncharacterized protein n=1 Tax=Proteus vulgaris TaxID=585 RepID=A0A379FEI1_PROVU|nr:Uncharacterised protein [Proteus vulgaris]VTP86447.1 Uncharacterised protein [Proteus vulgaris]